MNKPIHRSNNGSSFFIGRNKKLALFALTLLTGCAQGSNLAALPPPPAQQGDYHLGVGDQIRVITYDESQLTNSFTVGADGDISFPLLGPVQVAGLTVEQLTNNLTAALERGQIISSPSVSVQITEYRPISVLGEVNHPGQYPYEPGMTMLDAVALAGGFTYRAVTDYASDWQPAGPTSSNATQNKIGPGSALGPGDVITVYERYF